MSLYTIGFVAFLFLVFILYYVSPHRLRWALLLLASVFFYLTYSWESAILIGTLILANYFLGLRLERLPADKRGGLLWAGIAFDLGLLLFYKFFGAWLGSLPLAQGNIILSEFFLTPIGLSFHALQAVSYLIEVGRGNQAAERHAGIFALSILFFPRVLAGPIERPAVIEQFKTPVAFDYETVTEGMKTLAWGFFKKMVIADRLIPMVNMVYLTPREYSGVTLFYTVIVFAFALYADFSGYSDIAVGAARMFGIKLTQNFSRPYAARSISEFWQRWHISLSNWLRDYIFFPVRRFLLRKWGRRAPLAATILPPIVTMLASGLWHGSGWTFLVWGLLHGLYLVFFQLTEGLWQRLSTVTRLDRLPKLTAMIQQLITFILVSFSLVFFRANSLEDAFYILAHAGEGLPAYLIGSAREVAAMLPSLGPRTFYKTVMSVMSPMALRNEFDWFLMIAALGIFLILDWTRFDLSKVRGKPGWVRWTVYTIFITATLLLAVQSVLVKEFIYFRF
ncbi:MAG: hypothetical protein HFACDABA_02201 [Anaerolineales bacterium]|nr:hypothetical protein [Anaerolineales bacterium]